MLLLLLPLPLLLSLLLFLMVGDARCDDDGCLKRIVPHWMNVEVYLPSNTFCGTSCNSELFRTSYMPIAQMFPSSDGRGAREVVGVWAGRVCCKLNIHAI